MFRRILQAVVFGTVCVATWVALKPVWGQIRVAKQISSIPAPPLGEKKLTPPGTAVADPIKLSKHVTSYANNSHFAVQLGANNQAVVDASVDLGDTHPRQAHMWVLRIKSEDNTTLWTARYDNQLFEVTPARGMTPTFHDVITVPPGKSWVRLTLYRFPNNIDPALFDDEEKSEPFTAISRSQQVDAF